MEIGIGLPNAVPGTTGRQLTGWARAADQAGFSSLGNDRPDRLSDAERNAERCLRDYYAWLGDEISGMIAESAAKDAETVKAYISVFESTGCDELIIFPCSSDPGQVDLLAEAAGL
jgi:hypothetical protein